MSNCQSVPEPVARLDEAVSELVGDIQSAVRDTVEEANTTIEREVFAVGDALQAIVDVARRNIEETRASFDALAGDHGDQGVAELLRAQSSMAHQFAGDVQHNLDRQRSATERTSSLSEKIVALSRKVADVASQSRLLSLNASIEAARLGAHGAAFATIASEMRRLTEDVDSTNMSMSDIATEKCAVLPEIEEHADVLRQRSDGFSGDMTGQLEKVDAATGMLGDTVRAVRESADRGLSDIITASQRALSHLQFQEASAVVLVRTVEDVRPASEEINALVANSGAGAVEVCIAASDDGPEYAADLDIEAGEVMLF